MPIGQVENHAFEVFWELSMYTASEREENWCDRRRLTSLQMNWLEPKLKARIVYTGLYETDAEPTPLYLFLVYDMTPQWHSYDEKPDQGFNDIETTKTAIAYLYAQLCKKHNDLFFKRAMSYLQQAGGLTEIELQDMRSVDNEVLQAIFVHYLPSLNIFRIASTLGARVRNDM